MNQSIRITGFLLLCSLVILPRASVEAVPVLPSSFYGIVRLNQAAVPEGTLVEALIGGKVYATGYTSMYGGDAVFSLDVRGDDTDTNAVDGGVEGDIVQFRVGGVLANQTGTWHSGTNTRLDLTLTTSTPLQQPQPTRTPPPTQTAVTVDRITATLPATQPPASAETPLASATPDVGAAASDDLPGLSVADAEQPAELTATLAPVAMPDDTTPAVVVTGEAEKPPMAGGGWLLSVIGVAVLIVGGSLAVWYLSRK